MPQKRFDYYINGTKLETDPKGWSEHTIGFTRSEDFGLNTQIVVPLSFSGNGRDILKSLYEQYGIFSNAKVTIKKRNNDWTMSEFYVYKLDFSTYKDNLKFIEISGIEDGLLSKFQAYKDTEYEIDLPVSNKVFIDYTGAKYITTNQIQAKYGELEEKKSIGVDYYVIGGGRAVRAYNNKIAFTDSAGLPYETMTFRALQTASIDLQISLKITIKADAALGQSKPSSGVIKIVKHNAAFGSATVAKRQPANTDIVYTVSSSTTTSNKRIDTFNSTHSETISIESGYLYSLFYEADDKSYDKVSVTDGGKCYIDISNEVDSAYQNAKLEAFSYEWLIEQLLLKIDSSAEFASTVAYPNVKELISCTPCIQNMGQSNGTGKIKTTLKDVLESFNKLKCIAIDITGNKMTISNRLKIGSVESKVYPTDSSYGLITVNNIVVEHDISHQYNKVKVGANTDDRRDDDPLVYPFICEKQYNVENTLSENELDLVNNFMLDPYAIDKYIIDTLSKEDVKDECKFVVFAIDAINPTIEYAGSSENSEVLGNPNTGAIEEQIQTSVINVVSSKNARISISAEHNFEDGFTPNSWSISVYEEGGFLVESFSGITHPSGSYKTSQEIKAGTSIDILYVQSYEIDPNTLQTEMSISLLANFVYREEIYKDHTIISGFKGDAATIYNIPLTPQRILNRWKEYLAISFVGSSDKTLKFGTTKILNSAIVSKCDYEASNVSENTDFSLTSVPPVFLPSIISVDTPETIIDVNTFEDEDKYKYFEFTHQKTGKIYQGWINSATFAPTKNKTQKLVLQAKTI